MATPFPKEYKSPSCLVQLLKRRGLIIFDEPLAESYLMNIGYYRFSAYLYPLLQKPKEQHVFKKGCDFSDAVALYKFDKKLRQFLFNEIEKIEIAVRSSIANITTQMLGNKFWMTERTSYSDECLFHKTMELIDSEYSKSKEDFITHFRAKYSNPYPPAWVLIEILPFGVVTRIFDNLVDFKIKKRIAQHFALNIPVFRSWMSIVTLTRNACCHHSRIWNKVYTRQSLTIRNNKRPWISQSVNTLRIFYNICIIKWFIDTISPNNDMKQHLLDLLYQFPEVDIHAMGFPDNWDKEPLWK